MITRIAVTDYQCLADLDVPLGPLTVIVGPSSSGKSALTRAIATLTGNTRGSAFVSAWAKRTILTADFADGPIPRGTLTLTRGSTTASDSYVIEPPDITAVTPPPSTFTKLGGTTPPEVVAFTGIPAHDPLIFATQFDRPYLLAEPPALVARTFAALTNVHIVFAAAREASRTRAQTASLLKVRTADLAQVSARLPEFTALKDQRTALTHATAHLSRATALAQRHAALVAATTALHTAAQALDAIRARYAPSVAPMPAPACVDPLQAKAAHLAALRATLAAHAQATAHIAPAIARTHKAAKAITATSLAYTDALIASGTCPTCGQVTTHVRSIPLRQEES